MDTEAKHNADYIKCLLDKQRKFFQSGATLDIDFRITKLKSTVFSLTSL